MPPGGLSRLIEGDGMQPWETPDLHPVKGPIDLGHITYIDGIHPVHVLKGGVGLVKEGKPVVHLEIVGHQRIPHLPT